MVHSRKKLADKTKYIAELFRLFNVGLLVIDEIQRFNTKKNKLESFETIMTMLNTSKVALFVVGTQEAYRKFFFEYYFTRRLGTPRVASVYCRDYEYSCKLIQLVMSANWFNPPQKFTPKIVQTMYVITSGIIERIVVAWKAVQHAYLRLSDEERAAFVLTPEFIEQNTDHLMAAFARQTLEQDMYYGEEFGKTIRKSRTALPSVGGINSLPKPDSTDTPVPMNKTIADTMKDPGIFKTLSESGDIPRTQKLFERAKRNLAEGGDNYADGFILQNIVHTMELKSYANKSDDEIIAKSLKTIRKHTDQEINLRAMEVNEASKDKTLDFTHLTP